MDEKEKVKIFKNLEVSKYIFVNFKKVVFLEGDFDKNIMHSAGPTELELRFEVLGYK